MTALPPWATPNFSLHFDNIQLTSQGPTVHWMVAHMNLTYHLVTLMMCKSKITTPGTISKARSVRYAGKLQESAYYVTYVVGLFLRDNPNFGHVGPYICTCIFEAGLAWLTLTRISPDPMLVSQCDQSLVLLIRALDNIGRFFIVAQNQKEILEKLRMSRFAVKQGATSR